MTASRNKNVPSQEPESDNDDIENSENEMNDETDSIEGNLLSQSASEPEKDVGDEEFEDENCNNADIIKYEKPETPPGVIYVEQIPFGMTVRYLRDYFSQFGNVCRMYLREHKKNLTEKEKKKIQKERLEKPYRLRRFQDGWVEFENKKIAKKVASSLNGEPVGSKTRNRWKHCIWSIRYLHQFRFEQLRSMQIYRQASLESRLRAELVKKSAENKLYIQAVKKRQTQFVLNRKREERQAEVLKSINKPKK